MAKGKSIRPPNKPDMARVVADINDSTRDKFVTHLRAGELLERGLLKPIDLGPAYPWSYKTKFPAVPVSG